MTGECAQLSFRIRRETGAKLDNEQLRKHVPKSVAASYEIEETIPWNNEVNYDTAIPNNKPAIINRDNEEGTYLSIDAADSARIIMIKKTAENILK